MAASKNLSLAVIVGVLVASGVFAITQNGSGEPAAELDAPSESTLPEVTRQEQASSTPADAEPQNVESISLEPKNGYIATGEASRSYTDITFVHEVVAEMGPPAEGKFYEGWLVGSEGFISTGALESEDELTWSLLYSVETDERARNQVVITEETEANGFDNIPETHVLEGEFVN